MFWNKKRRRGKHRHSRRKSGGKENRAAPPEDARVAALEKFVVEEIELGGVPDVPEGSGPRSVVVQSEWRENIKIQAGWLGLWGLLVLAGFFTRTLWPGEEGRVTAIAWEMWQRGEFLLPHLNGRALLQTPPLFYWMVHLGWRLFDVNAWWPRLLPALFALFNLSIVSLMARLLWPQARDISNHVPWVLLGSLFWAVYLLGALPDMLTVFFVLLSLLVLLWMRQTLSWFSGMLLGVSMALALLSGGLFILAFVLPPALLAPFWIGSGRNIPAGKWYFGLFKAIVVALLLSGGWLLLVAREYGTAHALAVATSLYRPAISTLFSAGMNWWWYLALLPLVLLPWSVWPLGWNRLWLWRQEPANSGMRFCISWFIPALILLSVFGSRQPQLLLPLIPALALMLTYLFLDNDLSRHAHDHPLAGMSIPLIVIGGLLAALPKLPRIAFLPDFLWTLSPFIGVTIALLGIALAWIPLASITQRVMNISIVTIMLVVFAIMLAGWQLQPRLDVQPIARALAHAEAQGRAIAYVGDYRGDYHFAGRLKQPFVILQRDEVAQWVQRYPNGVLVTMASQWQPRHSAQSKPLHSFVLNEDSVILWYAATLAEHP
ncbi:MAG: hypothetical protein BMS9Abin36_0997 [Gammaproteobacteria bacterium]|nr:MAG: hypothetical protein BMS9Abin36_0997 [Gammaproteobacteria bacterium]